jgi:hypothetical protein
MLPPQVVRWAPVVALAASVGLGVSALVYQATPPVRALAAPAAPITLHSYGVVTVVVHTPGAAPRPWQLWRADTTPLIEHGLMHVTDPGVGGRPGMLFEFAGPTTQSFWMKDTPLPLTVVFINIDGTLQPAQDMTPCGDSDDCPTYAPSAPYRFVLEVPQHRLATLGLVPGASIEVPSP